MLSWVPRRGDAGVHVAVIVGIAITAIAAVFAPSFPTLAENDAEIPAGGTRVAFLQGGLQGGVAAALAPRIRRELTVRRGDTLMRLMVKAGIPRSQAHAAIAAMKSVYDPRAIMPGQSLTVTYSRDGGKTGAVKLQSVDLATSVVRKVSIARTGADFFTATEHKAKLRRRHVRVEGVIRNSLYRAGAKAGLPASVLADLTRIFAWDVDFQRDIQPGDRFDVVFERFHTADGAVVRDGEILFVALTLSGERRELYRFEFAPGRRDYFDRKGRSARKALLRTPVDGARLASRYGRRRHPVLGYTRMHRGVDFAAARGTPIFAAGDGRIEYRGRNGAYGRYIRIRHNARYQTAYGHMHRFARGLTKGARVKQGQIIGYVGSSGLSTGPHLHFEVLAGGRQTNPLTLRMPSGKKLKGRKLADFEKLRARTDRQIAELGGSTVEISRR